MCVNCLACAFLILRCACMACLYCCLLISFVACCWCTCFFVVFLFGYLVTSGLFLWVCSLRCVFLLCCVLLDCLRGRCFVFVVVFITCGFLLVYCWFYFVLLMCYFSILWFAVFGVIYFVCLFSVFLCLVFCCTCLVPVIRLVIG